MAVKIIIAGAYGRMGRAIIKSALSDPGVQVAGAFERPECPALGRDVGEVIGEKAINVPIHPDIRECIECGEVLIDFTQPNATISNLQFAVQHKVGMIIGTTGLTAPVLQKIYDASKKIPVVQSPNMSLGVNLMFRLAQLVGEKLNDDYDVEIVETHHKHKKDAPSGTALELVRFIAAGRNISLPDVNSVYGRKGATGERKKGSIGIHAVRGGDVVGEHIVSFLADGERLELVHRASSRDAFARGAILAAKFVAKKKSGFYNMQQVLGL
jgi:4-hydroxy-tetrahydrodipicolinate reductase